MNVAFPKSGFQTGAVWLLLLWLFIFLVFVFIDRILRLGALHLDFNLSSLFLDLIVFAECLQAGSYHLHAELAVRQADIGCFSLIVSLQLDAVGTLLAILVYRMQNDLRVAHWFAIEFARDFEAD